MIESGSSIEEVWQSLCRDLPGLAESPATGIAGGVVGPLTYCEGRLTGLIARALGLTLDDVWFTEGLCYGAWAEGNLRAMVTVTAGYGAASREGYGEAECEWGDTARFPTKEARLWAVRHLLDMMRPALEAEAQAKAEQAARGIFISGTPLRRIGL